MGTPHSRGPRSWDSQERQTYWNERLAERQAKQAPPKSGHGVRPRARARTVCIPFGPVGVKRDPDRAARDSAVGPSPSAVPASIRLGTAPRYHRSLGLAGEARDQDAETVCCPHAGCGDRSGKRRADPSVALHVVDGRYAVCMQYTNMVCHTYQ